MLGCGGETPASAAPAAAGAPSAAPVAAVPAAAAAAEPTAPVAPPPTPEPATPAPTVDLLHAVPTVVATSSAYREDPAQIARLFDGDVATAWNSRTGDLEGAWIEFVIPAGATVASIEMTAGYTREGGATDLFTGNHRVSRVRVTRDGASLGDHPLDTSVRTLQAIPVSGGPGVYRVELLELLAGTRTDWLEACVSEVRVLGTLTTASAPTTSAARPTTRLGEAEAVDETSEPPTEEGIGDPIAGGADLGEGVVQSIGTFSTDWSGYEEHLFRPDPSRAPRTSRRELIEHVIALVEPNAPERVPALRALIEPDSLRWEDRAPDLVVIVEALDAAFRDISIIDACFWAGTRSNLFIARVELIAMETAASLAEEAEDEDGDGRDARRAEEFVDFLESVDSTDPESVSVFRSRRPPAVLHLDADWDRFLAAAERQRQTCAEADEPEEDSDEY